MAFAYYEGTKDYLVMTPALLVTFRASGSISAGQGVAFDAGGTSDVYVPTTALGATPCAGIALRTVSSGDPVTVLVWGYAKNLTSITQVKTPGMWIALSGSAGAFAELTTGSFLGSPNACAGKVVSGSASATGKFMAFIDCMK
jgi:hypothetical protein